MSMFYRGKPMLRSCENLFDNDLSILCTLAQSSCMQILYSFPSGQTITNLRKQAPFNDRRSQQVRPCHPLSLMTYVQRSVDGVMVVWKELHRVMVELIQPHHHSATLGHGHTRTRNTNACSTLPFSSAQVVVATEVAWFRQRKICM